jgi:hypothetical protein
MTNVYLFTGENAENAKMTEKEQFESGIIRMVNTFPDSLRSL